MKKASTIEAKPKEGEGFTKSLEPTPKLSDKTRATIQKADDTRAEIVQRASEIYMREELDNG